MTVQQYPTFYFFNPLTSIMSFAIIASSVLPDNIEYIDRRHSSLGLCDERTMIKGLCTSHLLIT